MGSIIKQDGLPFTDDTIKYRAALLNDDNNNGTMDIMEEASKTAGRNLDEFTCTGKSALSYQQIQVGAKGEVAGVSYFVEKASKKWVINNVEIYHKYLNPSDLGKAFNSFELNR